MWQEKSRNAEPELVPCQFSLLGSCQLRAARPLAPFQPSRSGVCLPPPGGVTAPGTPSGHTQRQATRTRVDMLVVIRRVLTTSKTLRLQTVKNWRALQSASCAAICILYLIFLPPAARLPLDST